jgi:hypothetical protein
MVGRDTAGRMLWSTCDLSKQSLKNPIVLCPLGFLFNKEAVVRALIDKNLPKEHSQIRSLKDLRSVILTPNKAYDEARSDNSTSPFECPIMGVPANGINRFVALSCGHVISQRAVKESCSKDNDALNACPVCSKPLKNSETLLVNPSDEDLETARNNLAEARRAEAELKKAKKAERDKAQPEAGPVAKKAKTDDDDRSKPDKPSLPFGASKMVAPVSYHVQKAANVGKSAHSTNMKSETYKSMFISSSANDKRHADGTFKSEAESYMCRGMSARFSSYK